MNDELKQTLKLLPELSGCYLYYDKDNTVIYVGKAKNLKRRVYSYFHKQHESPKTNILVSQIEKLEYKKKYNNLRFKVRKLSENI